MVTLCVQCFGYVRVALFKRVCNNVQKYASVCVSLCVYKYACVCVTVCVCDCMCAEVFGLHMCGSV